MAIAARPDWHSPRRRTDGRHRRARPCSLRGSAFGPHPARRDDPYGQCDRGARASRAGHKTGTQAWREGADRWQSGDSAAAGRHAGVGVRLLCLYRSQGLWADRYRRTLCALRCSLCNAALVRRHCRENIEARIEYADTGRPIDLVTGKDIEVAPQRPHVDRQPRSRLTAIDQHLRAMPVCQFYDPLDWHERPGRIGHMGHRDEPGAGRKQSLEGCKVEPAGDVHRCDDEANANPVAQQLPWHNIRMVFEFADQYLVALTQKCRTPALRDEVDPLRRVAHKDDLATVGGVEEAAHLVSRFLVELGRTRAQAINAAMHIRIVRTVIFCGAVDDRTGFLRAGCRIEKYKIGVICKDREIAPQSAGIEPARQGGDAPQTRGGHPYSSKIARRRAIRDKRCSRVGDESTSSTASVTKASINIRRAASPGIPRVRR